VTCPECGSKLEYLIYYETAYNKYIYDGEGLKLVEHQINEWETYFACPYCGAEVDQLDLDDNGDSEGGCCDLDVDGGAEEVREEGHEGHES
jgi:hypothetical protein